MFDVDEVDTHRPEDEAIVRWIRTSVNWQRGLKALLTRLSNYEGLSGYSLCVQRDRTLLELSYYAMFHAVRGKS